VWGAAPGQECRSMKISCAPTGEWILLFISKWGILRDAIQWAWTQKWKSLTGPRTMTIYPLIPPSTGSIGEEPKSRPSFQQLYSPDLTHCDFRRFSRRWDLSRMSFCIRRSNSVESDSGSLSHAKEGFQRCVQQRHGWWSKCVYRMAGSASTLTSIGKIMPDFREHFDPATCNDIRRSFGK